MTVYRRRLVSDRFFLSFRVFSKLSNLFRPFIFFPDRSCPCGSDGTGFIGFGGQDVENEHGEVTRKANWYEVIGAWGL